MWDITQLVVFKEILLLISCFFSFVFLVRDIPVYCQRETNRNQASDDPITWAHLLLLVSLWKAGWAIFVHSIYRYHYQWVLTTLCLFHTLVWQVHNVQVHHLIMKYHSQVPVWIFIISPVHIWHLEIPMCFQSKWWGRNFAVIIKSSLVYLKLICFSMFVPNPQSFKVKFLTIVLKQTKKIVNLSF